MMTRSNKKFVRDLRRTTLKKRLGRSINTQEFATIISNFIHDRYNIDVSYSVSWVEKIEAGTRNPGPLALKAMQAIADGSEVRL
jgi:hypothetical protein